MPFAPGRTDATQAQTDVDSFAVLEPVADGFRNYAQRGYEELAPQMMLDKAQLLNLSAPEMTALLGGLRVLNANFAQVKHGVFTEQSDTLSNDFFVNLLNMDTTWQRSAAAKGVMEGKDRVTGKLRWTATVADLVFGSNSQLRAVAEAYASSDAKPTFVKDFVAVWTKVMNADRYELAA